MNTLSISALLFAASTAALAQTAAPPAPPVVSVVRVSTPWYAPRALVLSKMRDTIPLYAQLPGLAFKAFSIERTSKDFGGLYHWRDADAAKAWYNADWFERVRRERGVDGRVAMYDAPLSVDNVPGGLKGADPSTGVATLVLMRTPAGVRREQIEAEFQKAAPSFRTVPGLLRKHFIVSNDNTSFGGLYLWRDEASAQAWFNDAWHERVRKSYGQEAAIDWFDTPILLPTRDAANAVAASAMIVAPAP
jgi:heme-degrading monooxygenase HmoA